MSYKIKVYRSVFGNFYWQLFNSRKIAESEMIQRKDRCMKTIMPLAKKLKCKIDYIDLEKDFEE